MTSDVTHVDPQTLIELVYELVEDEALVRAQEHLMQCAECAGQLVEAHRLAGLIGQAAVSRAVPVGKGAFITPEARARLAGGLASSSKNLSTEHGHTLSALLGSVSREASAERLDLQAGGLPPEAGPLAPKAGRLAQEAEASAPAPAATAAMPDSRRRSRMSPRLLGIGSAAAALLATCAIVWGAKSHSAAAAITFEPFQFYEASGPGSYVEGRPHRFEFVTSWVAPPLPPGVAIPSGCGISRTPLSTLIDAAGTVLSSVQGPIDANGSIEFPASLVPAVPPVKLTLDLGTRVVATLATESERPVAHLQLERELLAPGDVLRFLRVLLNRMSLAPVSQLGLVEFTLRGPGETIVRSIRSDIVHGVAAQEWLVPATASPAQYRLQVVARFPARQVVLAERTFWVTADGNAPAALRAPLTAVTRVDCYPESGGLVVDVPSRVYWQARGADGAGRLARGMLVDDLGHQLQQVETDASGRGRFELHPEAGRSYSLLIEGHEESVPLPAARQTGVVLRSTADVYLQGAPIRLRVSPGASSVGIFCRGILVGSAQLDGAQLDGAQLDGAQLDGAQLDGTQASIDIDAPADAQGVLRAVAYNAEMQAVAERLIYARPRHRIHVSVTPDAAVVAPGRRIGMAVQTTDDSGNPCSAIVGLAVCDTRVAGKAVPLLGDVLLASETGNIEDAMGARCGTPEEALALDLLLGCQGARPDGIDERNEAPLFLSKRAEFGNHLDDLRSQQLSLRKRGTQLYWQGGALLFVALIFPICLLLAAALRALTQTAGSRGGSSVAVGLLLICPVLLASLPMLLAQLKDHDPTSPDGNQLLDTPDLPSLIRAPAGPPDVAADQGSSKNTMNQAYALELPRFNGKVDASAVAYWNPLLVTNADGRAGARFDTSHRETTWVATAEAHGAQRLGGATASFTTLRDFEIVEFRYPQQVTPGDSFDARLTLRSRGGEMQHLSIDLEFSGPKHFQFDERIAIELAPGAEATVWLPVSVLQQILIAPQRIGLSASVWDGETITEAKGVIQVLPEGVRRRVAAGGWTASVAGGISSIDFPLPAGIEPLRARGEFALLPNPAAHVQAALAGLAGERRFDLESNATAAWVAGLALEGSEAWLKRVWAGVGNWDGWLRDCAARLLKESLQRLEGFACAGGGYSLNGRGAGDEWATAYAMLGLSAGLRQEQLVGTRPAVDFAAAKEWMVARRPWAREDEIAQARILWALSEAGALDTRDLRSRVLGDILRLSRGGNPEVLAMLARAATLIEEGAVASGIAGKLGALQDLPSKTEEGRAMGLSGPEFVLEATAASALAFATEKMSRQFEDARTWLLGRLTFGAHLGTGPATGFLLLASLEAGKSDAAEWESYSPNNYSGGNYYSWRGPVNQSSSACIQLTGEPEWGDGAWGASAPGQTSKSHGVVPRYSIPGSQLGGGATCVEPQLYATRRSARLARAEYWLSQPGREIQKGPLLLDTSLSVNQVALGGSVILEVDLQNASQRTLARAIAVIPLPGGAVAVEAGLEALVDDGTLDHFAQAFGELLLFWNVIPPADVKRFAVELRADLPGSFTSGFAHAGSGIEFDGTWAAPLELVVDSGPRPATRK